MTLEILKKARIEAMRNKDDFRRDTIASLIGAVQQYGIDNMCRDNIPEDKVNAVLLKEQKTLTEMINSCPEDRPMLKNEYSRKMAIIKEFVPQLLTEPAQIIPLIKDAVGDLSFTKGNKGAIMKLVMPALKGKVDMKIASMTIDTLLQ